MFQTLYLFPHTPRYYFRFNCLVLIIFPTISFMVLWCYFIVAIVHFIKVSTLCKGQQVDRDTVLCKTKQCSKHKHFTANWHSLTRTYPSSAQSPMTFEQQQNRSKHSLPSFKPHTRTVPTKGFDNSPVILTASGKMNKLCVVWKLIHIGEVRLNFISLLCTNIPMFAIKRFVTVYWI